MSKHLCNYWDTCSFKNCRCKKKHNFTEGACDVKDNYCPEDQECLEMVEPEQEEFE